LRSGSCSPLPALDLKAQDGMIRMR
jgi:hypothetical protein